MKKIASLGIGVQNTFKSLFALGGAQRAGRGDEIWGVQDVIELKPLVRTIMHVVQLLTAALFLLLTAHDVSSQPQPKAFVCVFAGAQFSTFDAEWNVKANSDRLELTFAAIDAKNSRAQLIGNQGAETVLVSVGDHTINFLEITASGNQNLTTVFFKRAKSGLFPAVHSRHIAILGEPTVSHYRGYCSPRN